MRIVVFNCGSSSLKYRLIDMPSETELAAGEAERVGPKTALPGCIHHTALGEKEDHPMDMPDHGTAFSAVMKLLERDSRLVPEAIGHRMVHGGAIFGDHVIVDESAFQRLHDVQNLAPIHNPPALRLLDACRQLYPKLPETVVFDTAFHSTIGPAARGYALPHQLARSQGFRKYGFHGTSHQFVAEEAARFLGIPMSELRAISCHLGSGGASLCAIVNGHSVDNTMGYSPLQGLVMSTRSGDLDPAIALSLVARAQGDSHAVESMLNRKSGLLGLTGISADIRDLVKSGSSTESDGLSRAAQVYLWRIRKYLGSYLAVTERPHCIIFTDTIGEKIPYVRWAVTSGLDALGVILDPKKNAEATTLPVDLSAPQSRVRILAIATNEEVAIARASYTLLCRVTNEGFPS
jgi:acetate kinase